MKIPTVQQIRLLDEQTIEKEPTTSIKLMERASLQFVNWFCKTFKDEEQSIQIYCGPGNNGGDGLAIARLLTQRFYTVEVFCCEIGQEKSADFIENQTRLKEFDIVSHSIHEGDSFPIIPSNAIIIDTIFGAGLNRSIEGYWASLIQHLNQHQGNIVAVDIPSGLFADQTTSSTSIHATHTFSFEFPKLAFLFPENQERLGDWTIESIALHPASVDAIRVNNYFLDHSFIKNRLHHRKKFDHKGIFGHALLIAGSYGKVGAAILAAKAALRSGTGLVSIHAPKCAYPILQMSIPEAMVSIDSREFYIAEIPNLSPYKSVGIGCGLDTKQLTLHALEELLDKSNDPLVIDADALNLISQQMDLLDKLPHNSILTPHPKEFERLFGKSKNDFEQNELQRQMAQRYKCYIVLKRAHTCIATPEGECYFNSTGNPGMATAGSGDVLTGIITGLLAQGYSSLDASLIGTYIHGYAGDIAVQRLRGQEALIASDIIENLGQAFTYVRRNVNT